jgi:CBS domain-containing protein
MQGELLSLATARVRDAYLRRPFEVDGALDLVSVCRALAREGLTHALVRDGERLGDVARFAPIDIDADAELFEALWAMVRHRVHRLVVREAGQVIGVLGQLDLVSFVANHSHIVALQIDDATGVADLQAASRRIDAMIALLREGGTKVERIARLVGELNTRLMARLWSLLAPPEVLAGTCLLAMGSEGRGEQLLKTDQDNALLLRDGFDAPGLEALAQRFNDALAEFGYPPCPGQIMVSNPQWRRSLAAMRETLRDWVYGAQADGVMHLAIFVDAVAVAGDVTLLERARDHLDEILSGSDTFLARFASAADQFSEPGNWFTRLTSRRDDTPLDLKKLGTFPIVHGVRALALRHRLRATGTVQRLTALVEAGAIDAALARDLVDALHFLMTLRLDAQLRQRAAGAAASNVVLPSELRRLEREALHDAMAIVRRFRTLLRERFHLDAL